MSLRARRPQGLAVLAMLAMLGFACAWLCVAAGGRGDAASLAVGCARSGWA